MEEYILENKPIYIYGKSGTGKTTLINKYFMVDKYNLFVVSLKNINPSYFISDTDVMSLFNKVKKEKVIIIDDIDVLNVSEKKIINDIIKMLKHHKKNKIPFLYKLVLSGINHTEKKIKELISLCNSIHLTNNNESYNKNIYIHIQDIISKTNQTLHTLDTEKATQCLLFHENIINDLTTKHIGFYNKFLLNFCNGDYYDRISFQKQLWLYNDISYHLKFIYNWYIYNNIYINVKKRVCRFTKILTKYSTEYNNKNFIILVSNLLNKTKQELYNMCLNSNQIPNLTQSETKRIYTYFNITM
jgi:nucleoside-triphosphatase THEP1